MRRRTFTTVMMLLGLVGIFTNAGAQAHPTSCPEFLDRAAAQTYFDAQGPDYENLDANDNGIACDESTASSPVTASDDEAVVNALPSTGSGQTRESSPSVMLFASLSTLVLAGALIGTRRFGSGSA